MGLLDLKLGKLKLPLYDLGTLAAGFYIGYNEGKGVDTNVTIEYLTKYAPTAFAMGITMNHIIKPFTRWMNWQVAKNLENGNLNIKFKDGTKKYKYLNEDEKKEITPKIVEGINNLESKLQNPKYLKPTLAIGTRTAIETVVGYVAGRLLSN
ncbi:hypothetical protein KAR52_02590 [Candidatus Pacearchaeota archaeon]|nr:hypothetical protein [Candidatus Pacearchaeota archaeon]